jgi:glycosyltransferase involved in cell wall biosynthesis
MRVAVVHPSLNRGGGAERVCLAAVRALTRAGYGASLATIDRTDWRLLEERFGKLLRPPEERYILESMPAKGGLSQAAFTLSCYLPLLLRLRAMGEFDVILNTYGDLVESVADISYINALPVRLAYHYPESGFPNSVLWRLAGQGYGFSLTAWDRVLGSRALVANSLFMQGIVRKHLGREAVVVHPPVEVERFMKAGERAGREDLVATVSRLRPGKQLELIPRVARLVEKADFKIVGLADGASRDAADLLDKAIKALGVDDRVELLVNQPSRRLVEVLASAKVYLHTQPLEAFGISIVEAMAAGCVPIVPRCGGPWLDVLASREGAYGFSYRSVAEAAGRINLLMRREGLWAEVSASARRRALAFDHSLFERRIVDVVECAHQ